VAVGYDHVIPIIVLFVTQILVCYDHVIPIIVLLQKNSPNIIITNIYANYKYYNNQG
jgi:hypothetical protein